MHTNEPREDPLVDMGYEIRDVQYGNLRKGLYWYFGFAVFSALAGWTIYNNRFAFFALPDRPAEISKTLVRQVPQPPNPLLQDNVDAKTDIAVLRKMERERMTTTGFVDDAHTIVHIPIDRAMDLVAKNGLPATGTQAGPAIGAAPVTSTTPIPAASDTLLNSQGSLTPKGPGATPPVESPKTAPTSTTPPASMKTTPSISSTEGTPKPAKVKPN